MSTQVEIETRTESHSEQQAKAQLESIREMLAALDRDKSIELYVEGLSYARCVELLTEDAGIETVATDYGEDNVDILREMVVEQMQLATIEPDDFKFDEDDARQTIDEDPLSVEIRSGWYTPGSEPEPEDFCILLCTGGPAVRIRGELGVGNEPSRAWLEHQDWGTPWTQYYEPGIQDTLLEYARCFYFGRVGVGG